MLSVTESHERSRRREWSWPHPLWCGLIGLCAVMTLVLLLFARASWRKSMVIQNIEAGGGMVQAHDHQPLPLRLIGRLWGFNTDIRYDVWMKGPHFNDAWLDDHDHLQALRPSTLVVTETSLSRDAVRTLLTSHRLSSFTAADAPIVDRDLELLRSHGDLTHVNLVGTPLSGAALGILEDRRLMFLGVAGTGITAENLSSLETWTSLTGIGLDGRQLTDDVVDLLGDLKIGFLMLSGPDVTDTLLLRLTETKSLTFLTLDQAAVTKKGIDEFRASRPDCGLHITTVDEQLYQW